MDELRVKHNQIKFELLESAINKLRMSNKDRPITLLDLGVGRANDINKWRKLGIETIIGIDPSTDQLNEAKNRINSVKNYKRANESQSQSITLLQLDLSDKRDIKKMYNQLYTTYFFDIVCSFFSVHYFINNLALILDSVKLANDCEFVSVFMCLRPCMFLFEPYFENEYIYIKKENTNEVVVKFKDAPYFTDLQFSQETPLDPSMIIHAIKTHFKGIELNSFVKYYKNIENVSNDILLIELMHVSLSASSK